MGTHNHALPQDVQDQEDSLEEDEAESPHPTVDPSAHWQHHPVQCQASSLASHEAQPVNELQCWNELGYVAWMLAASSYVTTILATVRYHIEERIKRGCAVTQLREPC